MDAQGNVIAWEGDFYMPQQTPGGFLVPLVAATLSGMPAADHIAPGNVFQNSAIPYKFPNIKTVCKRLETTPFRPSWIRTPGRMQNTYANECFMDELAAAANMDPLEFRLKYLDDKRGLELLDRLAGSPSGRSVRRRKNRRAATWSRGAAFRMSNMSWCALISAVWRRSKWTAAPA